MTTLYQRHVAKWQDCRRCMLCRGRKQVVLARGKVPCDVLFIGEAPGTSEDVLGVPFVGPAGKLLDRIIDVAIDGQYDYCLTNLVACIPMDEDGRKQEEPPIKAIETCRPRLTEVLKLCRAGLLVRVGRLATKHLQLPALDHPPKDIISITHPAAILRMDVSRRSLAVDYATVVISDALGRLGIN